MEDKKEKKLEKKFKSKSQKRRIEVSKKSQNENSNVVREDVKYLVTFLKSTGFRGVAYEKGDTIELSEHDPKIHSKRTDLKIERLGM